MSYYLFHPRTPAIHPAVGKLVCSVDGVEFSDIADITEANEAGIRNAYPAEFFRLEDSTTWEDTTFYLHGCKVPFTLCFDVYDVSGSPSVFLRTEEVPMGPSAPTATITLAADELVFVTYGKRRF